MILIDPKSDCCMMYGSPTNLDLMQDVEFLKTECRGQQKLLANLVQRKTQLLQEDLPKICSSLGSLQCLEIVKVLR